MRQVISAEYVTPAKSDGRCFCSALSKDRAARTNSKSSSRNPAKVFNAKREERASSPFSQHSILITAQKNIFFTVIRRYIAPYYYRVMPYSTVTVLRTWIPGENIQLRIIASLRRYIEAVQERGRSIRRSNGPVHQCRWVIFQGYDERQCAQTLQQRSGNTGIFDEGLMVIYDTRTTPPTGSR